jgi:beta-lysine 5,6-aminomutase alpha subunit
MRDIGDEIVIKPDGLIGRRASEVLRKAEAMLAEIRGLGLLSTLEKGLFAGVRRDRDGGRGLDGVFEKGPGYRNPFIGVRD